MEHHVLPSAVKAFRPFTRVLAVRRLFCHLQTKADEKEDPPNDVTQEEEVPLRNRAASGISNPGRGAAMERNPRSHERLRMIVFFFSVARVKFH